MTDIIGLNLEINEVSQEIVLEDIGLGHLDDAGATMFAQDCIDYMLDRVESKNQGNNGKKLKGYSTSYKKSKKFENFSKGNNVDMTLTGNMLGSIDIIEAQNGIVKFGIIDDLESAKAYGHMTGMKKHKYLSGVTPIRPFFGLNKKELKEIAKDYKKTKKYDSEIFDLYTDLTLIDNEDMSISVDDFFGDIF